MGKNFKNILFSEDFMQNLITLNCAYIIIIMGASYSHVHKHVQHSSYKPKCLIVFGDTF